MENLTKISFWDDEKSEKKVEQSNSYDKNFSELRQLESLKEHWTTSANSEPIIIRELADIFRVKR